MTLITVSQTPDCWDNQFPFYNLSQNINSLKGILQILWSLVAPNSKRQLFFTFLVQQLYRNSLLFSRYMYTQVLGVEPVTLLRGHTGTKWKVHIVMNFILNNFCSILFVKYMSFSRYKRLKICGFSPFNA